MRNTILGIIALGVIGACNSEPKSEPKDEVGRYVPIGGGPLGEGYNILDTKTGVVYDFRDYEYGQGIFQFRRIDFLHPEIRQVNIKGIIQLKGKSYEQGNSNK